MKARFRFEKLEVWQAARQLNREITHGAIVPSGKLPDRTGW